MNIKIEIKPYHTYEIHLTARYSEKEESKKDTGEHDGEIKIEKENNTGRLFWQAQAQGAEALSFWDKTKKYEEDSMEQVLKKISKDLRNALDEQEAI